MTALTAGLALIPLVLAGGKLGNEIQSPGDEFHEPLNRSSGSSLAKT
jgi:hypothetical protein